MFTRLTRYLAYIVMIWLWAISLNLTTQGQFLDIAVRDILMDWSQSLTIPQESARRAARIGFLARATLWIASNLVYFAAPRTASDRLAALASKKPPKGHPS